MLVEVKNACQNKLQREVGLIVKKCLSKQVATSGNK